MDVSTKLDAQLFVVCLALGYLARCHAPRVPLQCGHTCNSLCDEKCPEICQECIAGARAETKQIQLPCGHAFDVEWLDEQFLFRNVYEVGHSGDVTGFRQPAQRVTSILDCPACSKPLSGVKRYASIQKLRGLHGEVDQAYARFGQLLTKFESQLSTYENGLQLRFTIFCSSITLSPLANAKNQYLIQQRGSGLDEFQTSICNFRDEFVKPFEHGVRAITSLLANPVDYPVPVLPFALRFKLLYFKCRLMTLTEGLATARFLRGQNDPTNALQGIGLGLFMLAQDHARENNEGINKYIQECKERHLKCLEVEFRLAQACFVGYANQTKYPSHHRMNDNTGSGRIEELVQAYPSTAGRFKGVVDPILGFARGASLSSPLLEVLGGPGVHHELGEHQVGHLTHCGNGHPYSAVSFKHCPECGPKAPPVVDYNAMLASDSKAWVADFMSNMSLKK
ncbi:MAG: hypothetical protein M1839_003692 [Geoglossum umbratile]|nr:MAG: hypothetical protein M1839_003692 [Geoglossum umbratile]